MDFIILNSDGSLQKQSLTRYIQQGSHGVDEIFIGWVNATSSQTLQTVFTLPNQLTNTELGTFVSDYEYEPGETMSGWVVTLTENQTRYNGALMVSARIILNGIVQVAYPFALIINETGVRPETDSGITLAQLDSYLLNIQNLVTGAVRQNTDSALSPTSENPVQNKVITNAIETFKRGSFTKVDTTEYPTLADFLDTEGEEGYLYLYPVNTSDEDEGYYQYIWENDLWIPLGTTKIDIANMVTTDTPQEISGAKTFTTSTNIGDNTQSESPKLGFISTDANNQGNWYIFVNGNQNYFNICQLNGNNYVGIKLTRSGFLPTNTNYVTLGTESFRWKRIYVEATGIDFGSNAWVQKDGSNRIIITNNGNTKVKVGANETYFANHVEPDANNTYDLGGANVKWKTAYVRYLNDDSVNVAVSDIAQKGSTQAFTGTFDTNGEFEVTFTDGDYLKPGMYIVTYANAQAFIYIDSTLVMLASLGNPIRTSMPVVYNSQYGYTVPGMLRIDVLDTTTVGTDTRATRIRVKVSNGTQNAASTLQCAFYLTKLA